MLPSERGTGLGTLLPDCAEEILDDLGARDVIIGVLVGNDDALTADRHRGLWRP